MANYSVMTRFITLYVGTLVILAALDFVFLLTIGKALFAMVKDMTLDTPRILPGLLFYLVYAAAIVILVNSGGDWSSHLIRGLVLGVAAYATFEFTNMAVLKHWEWMIVGVDILWGAILTSAASVGGAYFASFLIPKL